jgi:hypothetical protein
LLPVRQEGRFRDNRRGAKLRFVLHRKSANRDPDVLVFLDESHQILGIHFIDGAVVHEASACPGTTPGLFSVSDDVTVGWALSGRFRDEVPTYTGTALSTWRDHVRDGQPGQLLGGGAR